MVEPTLSKRERQIMDIVFELGAASAADVHERLQDPRLIRPSELC